MNSWKYVFYSNEDYVKKVHTKNSLVYLFNFVFYVILSYVIDEY